MAGHVHRSYEKEWSAKVGSTINVRKPVQFTVTDGATRSNQDVTETNTSIAIDKQKHVSWNFTSQQLTLSIEEYSKRYIEPACIALANKVDIDLCNLYKNIYQQVGTAGTTPSTYSNIADAGEKLDLSAVPMDNRSLVLGPSAHWSLADGLKGVFNQSITNEVLRKGHLGSYAGMEFFRDQNIVSHTVGAHGGTPLVDGGTQTGSSLATDGWTTSTNVLEIGDVFTIAGVNSVNPISKTSTGQLQQFVVTSDETSDGSGDLTIDISPSITTSGAYQTVSGSPADNAAITVVGTSGGSYVNNMAFHSNAFALCMVPLAMPDGTSFKAQQSEDNISIRVIKDYDIANDTDIIRLDLLYGVKTIYPELAVRVLG